jgi:hypothetical protein
MKFERKPQHIRPPSDGKGCGRGLPKQMAHPLPHIHSSTVAYLPRIDNYTSTYRSIIMVSKRRPARTIYKPSGEATGMNRQAADDDAVNGQWQEQTTLTRDKSKNPRDSGRAKNPTLGADAAVRGVKTLGGAAASTKSLKTGAATRPGSPAQKKARKQSAKGSGAARSQRSMSKVSMSKASAAQGSKKGAKATKAKRKTK